jgi:hypothetical protein
MNILIDNIFKAYFPHILYRELVTASDCRM